MSDLYVIDSQGLAWGIDAETGRVGETVTGNTYSAFASYFASTDCSGPLTVIHPPAPRQPFKTSADGGWRVRGDTQAARALNPRSTSQPDGGCYSYGDAGIGVLYPAIDLPPEQNLTPPSLNFRGPLHIENG